MGDGDGVRPTLLLAAVLATGLAWAPGAVSAGVRVPRDSPVVVHGRVQGPASLDASWAPADRPRAPEWTRRPPRSAPTAGDPGYRPMWVPDSYQWNGFELIRVPGHWQW